MIEVALLLTTVLAILAGVAIGRISHRREIETMIDTAARRALEILIAEQATDDREALAALPPGVSRADAWELAGRRGISIREAAEEIFVAQARARLDANLDRHHRRTRRPTP